jgi:carbon-monoxide dehydrogenase large subunit
VSTTLSLVDQRFVGQSLKRVEDERPLRGAGRYVGDVQPPGLLHLAVLRSPHAHARFELVSQPTVDRAAGLHLVLTADSLRDTVRMMHNNPGQPGHRDVPRPVLADGETRFVGECIAAVVADDRYRAEDELEKLQVKYEALPAAVDLAQAAAPGATLVHPDFGDNLYVEREGTIGDLDGAFSSAAVVVERTVRTGRVAGLPIEPRGCLALYDRIEGRLTLWSSTQIPHILRSTVAEFLSLPETRVRVIAPDVGGGFGIKAAVYPEELLTCAAAIQLGAPVRWLEDRTENLLSSVHARDAQLSVRLAADNQGKVLGLDFQLVVNSGAFPIIPFGPYLEGGTAIGGILGPYDIRAYGFRAVAVATHTAPVGAYRGVGVPLGSMAIELALDEAAQALGLDRMEIRRRNLIRREQLPFANALGVIHDATSHVEALDQAIAAADLSHSVAASTTGSDRLIGVGICCYAENTANGSSAFNGRGLYRIAGYDSARVSVAPDGRATVAVSLAAQGQGHRTVFAQVAADQLGLRPEDIDVVAGDTDTTPYGSGTFASRSMVAGGGAILDAAGQVREKILVIAASLLEAGPSDLETADGVISIRGARERQVSFADVARVAYGLSPNHLPPGLTAGLEATVAFDPPRASIANGCHLAVVAVDPDTGLIEVLRYVIADDCGLVVNPAIVDGQLRGGVTQALGELLLEEIVYDADGALVTGSLLDYCVPATGDVPGFIITHVDAISDGLPTPFKGVGEGGVIGGFAAIASAVDNALRQRGAHLNRTPVTPQRVREALAAASARSFGS